MPTFSIVVPVYNRSNVILPTLESVRAQTFADFECLVVDDGSSDGEALQQVVDSLDDPRFIYIRRENGGGGAARNTGIDAARGRYLAFLDSDDLFLPHKLATVLGQLPDDPLTVLYAQNYVDRGDPEHMWVRPDRSITPNERVATYLFVANQFIQTSTIIIDTALARRVRFDPALRKGQDLDLCIRLEAAGARFVMLSSPLTIWRDVAESGRTSRTRGYTQPEAWLAAHKHMMSAREVAGYRATSLAYYWGWEKPLSAFLAIITGLVVGVTPSVSARQLARTFIPGGVYRGLVDKFVGRRGHAPQVD
ncbi:glycosyltransferase family 2 protein [Brevundimonas sp.]|uniref:glycosyltransferase family 2 protein n=1 Tax=Brevundimonas sp. TaxID=1871086 RepID=UPI0025C6D60F|nr:glycosyltransferase family 2 protein [Brevundimonas sp.]MCG2665101.1 glycosyltransferase [Brevundimonas sp.]